MRQTLGENRRLLWISKLTFRPRTVANESSKRTQNTVLTESNKLQL